MTAAEPPAVHDVTVAFHANAGWYALCATCGWHSVSFVDRQSVHTEARRHYLAAIAPPPKPIDPWATARRWYARVGRRVRAATPAVPRSDI